MRVAVRLAAMVVLGVAALAAIPARVAEPAARPQFNDERRRGDLTSIKLPGGSVVEFGSFESEALRGPEMYSVFLPPSFQREGRRTYPVVYFLHGLNNDHTSWTVDRYGNIQEKVERLILEKKIPEILMVHPRGDSSFYCNYADGSKRYEDLVTGDVVRLMESRYRARKGRENRALAGTSMGGFGALKIAMKYPDRYAAAVGHSPIIFVGRNPLDVPDELKQSRYYQFFERLMKPLFGDPFRQELWDANNPLLLAKSGKLGKLGIYFDYGTEDRYIRSIGIDRGAIALDRVLKESGVPHVFKVHEGAPHGWALVAAHIDESLPFLCRSFR